MKSEGHKQFGKREKMLNHLREHLNEWIHNQELRQITGLNDVPREVRALRQQGWQVEVNGKGHVRLVSLEKVTARGERVSIDEKTRYLILQRDNFRCRVCGRSASNQVKLTIDHIIPVDWGGRTEEGNLQTLCEECNRGKKAWVAGTPSEAMEDIMKRETVEGRIEALFENFPNQDLPSSLIQLVSRGALDWQRALRRIRAKGKRIMPLKGRRGYRYIKEE